MDRRQPRILPRIFYAEIRAIPAIFARFIGTRGRA